MRRPPSLTRTETLCPYTARDRSGDDEPEHLLLRTRLDFERDRADPFLEPQQHRPRAPVGRGRPVDRHRHAILRDQAGGDRVELRSAEHTSEIQSRMRNSYAVYVLTQNDKHNNTTIQSKDTA